LENKEKQGVVGLTPGVNLINVLRAAFACADPKSVKKDWQLDCLFALFGSVCVKAAHRMLMKLTPVSRTLNIFWRFLDLFFFWMPKFDK